MLTPIEIHNKQHKQGRGYSKKEMDEFLEQIAEDYETIYKENRDMKEKLEKLSDGIQYYKSMEGTLQKALVLAEKTSKDTIESANKQAGVIEKEARFKADQIISRGKDNYEAVRQQCLTLIQQYNQFKLQFKQIAIKQIELFDSDFYEIYTNDFMAKLNESIDNMDFSTVNIKQGDSKEPEEDTKAGTDTDEYLGDTKEIPVVKSNTEHHTVTLNDIIPIDENFNKVRTKNDRTVAVESEDSEDSFIKDLRSELSANINDISDSGSGFEFLDSDNL